MKASRFTDAQKACIVKRGEEGISVAGICREAGISEATFYNWRKKHADPMPTEIWLVASANPGHLLPLFSNFGTLPESPREKETPFDSL